MSSNTVQEKHWLTFLSQEINLNANAEFIELVFQIDPDMHIQANKLTDPNLIPTKISIDWPAKLEVSPPQYPNQKIMRLKGSEKELQVFSGKFTVKYPISHRPAGVYTIRGKMHYQACNEYKCFFPRTLNFRFLLNID
ncbi:protein-disulfide reductase DsbD domain-containing protein [Echinicola salinicaeni]|uniref:protein-disulfide reductase DsbD domain-containing protein n=1 Tax=Echinicola salinicaeni TaxID=2762757 RepID=UPI0016448775|nr:protein-disulfide reductase DsbD domain-containing protein [Echinicola salinicaeni]